jgi:lipooligosaccharide transport system permease protein
MSRDTPPGFVSGMYQVAARNLIVWRSYLLPSVLGNFGEPMLYLLALGFGLGAIIPELHGMSYAEFIAPGLIVSTVMYTSTFEATFGTYTRLVSQKTFDALLATPITVPEIVAGEVMFCGVKSAFGAASVLCVITLFGLTPSWLSLAVVPLGFVAGLMFSSMALVMTAVARSYEFFNYYFTLLVAPMFLFSGIFFPLDRAPRWAATFAEFLPLTHVVRLSRALVRGDPGPGLLFDLAVVVAVLLVAYTAAFSLLRSRMKI